ncbi:MAG TPA: molybdopterin-dependent oxidoreductase [Steroidobacteraceae bacterium]|nr:molybdopterin-dependent oxidoreductase [Steroidobacteraceae bacterium]
MTDVVRTTCPYCGVGCGVLATRRAGGVEISGDPDHPANAGRLCSKGAALGETLGTAERLLYPCIAKRRVRWDEALDYVAAGFTRIIREHGPDAVAFYISGQLLTEDYYVANKLMKGFIGTANIDTNSRLCMASAVAGHKRAFGADAVPGCYEDFELADLIVLVGSNAAWCHPVLYQRIVRAKERRPEMKVVVVDPRRTPTCDIADLHVPARAGSDVPLFLGLLAFLHAQRCTDTSFVAERTTGATEALAVALEAAGDVERVAARCGLDAQRVRTFYEMFARTERVVTAFSQGVNQSSAGTDKVNAIINCHLLTGRIGRPGMGPFSITGQPNAMGGREVGGMANMLAAHMDLENPAHRQAVQTFWNSPRMASRSGRKAVDMFDAIHEGRIKAVWIMATNPAVSLPDANRVREALQRCELVVVSDCVARTDTLDFAHVALPAAGWGEKDGTVTNSERRISRQRAFLRPPGEAKPDWWIVCEVAKRMGFESGFRFQSPHDIFVEHARLSGVDSGRARVFDISGLARLTRAEYDALDPVQWPVREGAPTGTPRLATDGRFFHADGKARFVPTPPRAPQNRPSEDFPFVLNTGRVRDQWHTMTRTGRAPRLADHLPEPYVDMHAQDALLAGVREGELVRVTSAWGSMVARLRTSGEITRGTVFVPIHWSAVNSSDARVGALVNPVVDPISGEPELKHTPVKVEPMRVDWYGVLFAREPVAEPDVTWWVQVRGNEFFRYELAGRNAATAQSRARGAIDASWARRFLGVTDSDADYIDYEDTAGGVYRAAWLTGDRLTAVLCIASRTQLPSRAWLASLFAKPRLDDTDRRGLLAGRPLAAGADTGPLVCSCFSVGRNTIANAIERHGFTTATQVGAHLKAGTNCGSCVPEIRALLAARAVSA